MSQKTLPSMAKNPNPPPFWHMFVPKLITVMREGYSLKHAQADLIAGLTVAIVAVPLSMALAIASGVTPDKGLITAVVAGFIISALGGSRVQVGGPAGAFVVIVYGIIQQHGYDGLVLATLMGGAMLVLAGLFRLGTWIKYIPHPVITGFTAGIGVIILSSQVKDFFGLSIKDVPAEFFEKWEAFYGAADTVNIYAIAVAGCSLALILALRRFAPRVPAFLVTVVGASVLVYALQWPVDTIGSVFGGIPQSLPMPTMPQFSLEKAIQVFPSAAVIAFLAGVESLLCAVVADGMIGRRHRSNCELVAQGFANMASAAFGGMPATGTIARTATNIRAGARTPIAGISHAIFVLLMMLLFAPLAGYIPLAGLAAILVVVAWNMLELHKLQHMTKAPIGDLAVTFITLALTVCLDLIVAIEVGVVLGAILFMHRMSEAVQMQTNTTLIETDVDDWAARSSNQELMSNQLPDGVEAFQIRGPLFFGVAGRLSDMLDQIDPTTRIFILRFGLVPMIDSSGEDALINFLKRCEEKRITVVLTNLRGQPLAVLAAMGALTKHGVVTVPTYEDALHKIKQQEIKA